MQSITDVKVTSTKLQFAWALGTHWNTALHQFGKTGTDHI